MFGDLTIIQHRANSVVEMRARADDATWPAFGSILASFWEPKWLFWYADGADNRRMEGRTDEDGGKASTKAVTVPTVDRGRRDSWRGRRDSWPRYKVYDLGKSMHSACRCCKQQGEVQHAHAPGGGRIVYPSGIPPTQIHVPRAPYYEKSGPKLPGACQDCSLPKTTENPSKIGENRWKQQKIHPKSVKIGRKTAKHRSPRLSRALPGAGKRSETLRAPFWLHFGRPNGA